MTAAPQATDLRFHAALSGRYVIDRTLGQGGIGTVYAGRDVRLGRQVAIKVLSSTAAAQIEPKRFHQEIRLTAQLQHPFILPVLDAGDVDGVLFYISPYVREGSLRGRLAAEKQLPVAVAISLALDVAQALDFAHRNRIVHCDIKPDNVLLAEGHPLVADFGLAQAMSARTASLTDLFSGSGTPAYMSPEQASGETRLDGRSDLYSAACVLYEMLGGRPPFTGENAREVVAKKFIAPVPPIERTRGRVPVGVVETLLKALSCSPEERHPTVAAFARDLRNSWNSSASAGGRVSAGLSWSVGPSRG